MNQQQILGVIRHALTFIGGILVTRGLLDEGMATEIIGGATTLIGTIWSIIIKSRTNG